MGLMDSILGRDKKTEEKEQRYRGQIIHLNKEQGYGFIVSKEWQEFTRIYFHWSYLMQDTLHFKQLEEKMMVSFVGRENFRGFQAIKVRVIEDEE